MSDDIQRSPWFAVLSIILIVLIGFFIRLYLSSYSDFIIDIDVNQGWMKSAVELGLSRSYSEQLDGNMLPNYPPFSMIIFWATGHAYHFFVSDVFELNSPSLLSFAKTPGIIADLLIIICLYGFLKRWKNHSVALVGAFIYAIHPASLLDSAIWGQTDSIYTLFLLCAVIAWTRRWYDATAVCMTLALMTKLQALVLVPLFLFLAYHDWKLFVRLGLVSLATIVIVLIPFALGGALSDIWNVYTGLVGFYPNVTVGSYNFWWMLIGDPSGSRPDSTVLFNLITYKQAGFLLYFVAISLSLFFCRKGLRSEQCRTEALFVAATLLASAFFLFCTQMHERYLFPYIALGIPLLFVNRSSALIYIGASVFFYMNLVGVFPYSPAIRSVYAEFDALDVFVACMQVLMFVALLWWSYGKYEKLKS